MSCRIALLAVVVFAISTGLGSSPSRAHHCLGGHADRPECAPPTATLGDLTCTEGQVAKFSGSAWVCTDLFAPKLVFVSSTPSTGNLGGFEGADDTCQDLADAAELDGIFKAWISTTANIQPHIFPLSRFTHSLGPYTLVDGTLVAQDFISLTSGVISNPIDVDEKGAFVGADFVWSSTLPEGRLNGDTCLNWTDGSSTSVARDGRTDRANEHWSNFGQRDCDELARIYCFEQ